MNECLPAQTVLYIYFFSKVICQNFFEFMVSLANVDDSILIGGEARHSLVGHKLISFVWLVSKALHEESAYSSLSRNGSHFGNNKQILDTFFNFSDYENFSIRYTAY